MIIRSLHSYVHLRRLVAYSIYSKLTSTMSLSNILLDRRPLARPRRPRKLRRWRRWRRQRPISELPLGIWESWMKEIPKWWKRSRGDKSTFFLVGAQEHGLKGLLEPNQVRTLTSKDCKFKFFFCAQADILQAENWTNKVIEVHASLTGPSH